MTPFEWLTLGIGICTGLLTVICILLWGIITSLRNDIGQLRLDFSRLELKMADDKLFVVNNYMRTEDIKSAFNSLNAKMEKMQTDTSNINLTLASIAGRIKVETNIIT